MSDILEEITREIIGDCRLIILDYALDFDNEIKHLQQRIVTLRIMGMENLFDRKLTTKEEYAEKIWKWLMMFQATDYYLKMWNERGTSYDENVLCIPSYDYNRWYSVTWSGHSFCVDCGPNLGGGDYIHFTSPEELVDQSRIIDLERIAINCKNFDYRSLS